MQRSGPRARGREDGTYNGQIGHAVCDEVVVEAREVGPATRLELETSVRLDGDEATTINDIEDLLLLLLDLLLERVQVLDNFGRAREGGGGRDIVQGRLVSQQRGAGAGEELLVGCSGGHGEGENERDAGQQ